MLSIVIALLFILCTLGFCLYAYYKMRELQKAASAAWTALNVHLYFRTEIVKNLSSLAAGYSESGKGFLSLLTRLKLTSGAHLRPSLRSGDEAAVSAALKQFLALAENTAELKNGETFISYKTSLKKSEAKIKQAAAFYNNAVRDYNTAVSIFPVNILAAAFDYSKADFFVFEDVFTPEDGK